MQSLLDIEVNFPSLYSDVIIKNYGKIFYNIENKQSWDSNHAIITNLNENLNEIIKDIKNEYLCRGITPRIFNSFYSDDVILQYLQNNKWNIEINESTFYVYTKKSPSFNQNEFIEVDEFDKEIEEVILSDPEQGTWATNTIRIGLQQKKIKAVCLRESKKTIGFYTFHNFNKITRVDNVYIHYRFRNRGFGKKLIQNLIKCHNEKYKDSMLYLWSSNPIAKRIYEQNGFEKIEMPGKMWNAHLSFNI